MSDAPNKLTRRSALALMGTASAVAAAAVTAQAAEEPAASRHSTQKYIFGYGSLIQIESRTRTVPKAFAAWPVIVKGITRGWYYQADVASLNPTYLGAENEESATTNGVIYPVTDSEFEATKIRESDYLPTRIEPSAITWLDGRKRHPDGEFWYFASKSRKPANAEHPIVQSYVDICVDGCLQIEEMYPLAKTPTSPSFSSRPAPTGRRRGSTIGFSRIDHSSTCRGLRRSTGCCGRYWVMTCLIRSR